MTGKPSDPPFSRRQVQLLFDDIHAELDALNDAAIPLVGGLLIAQEALPQALIQWLLSRLSERTDLTHTSPAAQAALRIGLLAAYRHEAGARSDLQAQFALIRALDMQNDLESAARFLHRLANHLERNLKDTSP